MKVAQLLNELKCKQETLEGLMQKYGIKVRSYDDRYVLNYDQYASLRHKFSDIVRICRNLIISKDFENVLHRSFDRFYNYGEDDYKINFCGVSIDEKLDGVLVGAYHDGEKWCFCTKSMAFAEGVINNQIGNIKTFADVINNYVDISPIVSNGDKDISYIFELVGPHTRIIKRYDTTRMVLLACRNKKTGMYIDRNSEGKRIGWTEFPLSFSFSNIDDVIEASKNLYERDEGYVLCTSDNTRVKIKNPKYLSLANMKMSGLSKSGILRIINAGEEDEYLAYFPEDKVLFAPYIRIRDLIYKSIDDYYSSVKNIEQQKDFALAIKSSPYKDILFNMRNKGTNAYAEIAKVSEKRLSELYDYFSNMINAS